MIVDGKKMTAGDWIQALAEDPSLAERLSLVKIDSSWEHLWEFWLDDTCYRVARGARYFEDAGECSAEMWAREIEPEVKRYQEKHGVLIRAVGDDVAVSIEVAAHQWVFDLLDHAYATKGDIADAIMGVLLGYDSKSIDGFLRQHKGRP